MEFITTKKWSNKPYDSVAFPKIIQLSLIQTKHTINDIYVIDKKANYLLFLFFTKMPAINKDDHTLFFLYIYFIQSNAKNDKRFNAAVETTI